jgi:hypothetical protein
MKFAAVGDVKISRFFPSARRRGGGGGATLAKCCQEQGE